MITKELIKFSENLNKKFVEQSKLISYLESVANQSDQYSFLLLQFKESLDPNHTQTFNKVQGAVNALKALDKKTLEIVRSYKPSLFISEVNELVERISGNGIFKMQEFPLQEAARDIIDLHTDAYADKDTEHIYSFVRGCETFVSEFEKFFFLSNFISMELSYPLEIIPSETEVIDIEIRSNNVSLYQLSTFLISLEEFYKKLCIVYGIHYEDYPLTIIKIETGSLWSKLLGYGSIINLFKEMIFGIAGYFRDIQTGKLSLEKFENSAKKSLIILDILEKAKSNNVSKENIVLLNKALGIAVTKIYKSLPEGTTEIVLNDQKLFHLNPEERKSIESREPLRIAFKNESSNTDT